MITIAMPSINGIPTKMAVFLYEVVKKYDVNIIHTERTEICSARISLIEEYLKGTDDYLLFLDDDNIPENIEFLKYMLDSDKDIISGLIPSRLPHITGAHGLCIFQEEEKPTGQHVYKQLYKIPEGYEIQEIANCGMGCVLIKREVVQAIHTNYSRPFEMRDVWYYKVNGQHIADYEIDPYGIPQGTLRYKRYMSEDLLFFERARKLGYNTWIHKGVRCEHNGITIEKCITK